VLKGQKRALYTDGGQKHDVADARSLGDAQGVNMRAVIYGPSIFRRARARGKARHQGIKPLARKTIMLQRCGICHVAVAHNDTGRQSTAGVAGFGAHKADNFVPFGQKGCCRGATDCARGP
jgi:hypothetical protein